MNIKKVDDKPLVIHTKEKTKIHSHEPKGASIKGSNTYTVDKRPKTKDSTAQEETGKKSYRKSTIHQAKPVREGRISKYRKNLKETNSSIKTKNTTLRNAGLVLSLIHI